MRKAWLIEQAENDCVVGNGVEQVRALCERAKFQAEWYSVRWKRLHRLVEEADIPEELKQQFSAVMANGATNSMEPPTYDQILNQLTGAIAQAAALADTGSHAHKSRFVDDGNGEPVAGWRVAEAMRDRLLDATKYSRLDG
jgi:hypothetical protein